MTDQQEVTGVADPAGVAGGRGPDPRPRRRWLPGLAVVAVAAGGLWLLVYAGPTGNVSADTMQYAYQT